MFIYVVDYGGFHDGSYTPYPRIFLTKEVALEVAREQIPRLGRLDWCTVKEYEKLHDDSVELVYTQICLVHEDEKWVQVETTDGK